MNISPELENSYRVLDLEPGASLEEIERAYRGLSKTWDPNRFGNDKPRQRKAEKKLHQIKKAYERVVNELKGGSAIVEDEEVEAVEEAAVEPAEETVEAPPPPVAVATGPQRHWSRSWPIRCIGLAGMVLAMTYLILDSYSRFVGIDTTTKVAMANFPLLTKVLDPKDPNYTITGYPYYQHVQVMPALGTDGYHWIMQMERMLDGREDWRVRHVDYDGLPGGREVHWSSSLHWLVAGLAWVDHVITHDPMPVTLERTEPWANTFVLGVLMIVAPILTWRRFGAIPAAIMALTFVTTYPYYEFSFVGYLDHHGLAASSDMMMVFCIAAAGAGWLRNEKISPDSLTPTELALWKWLPERQTAKVWMIGSGIAAGTGLWISTASVIPCMFGLGVGALISTGYLARTPEQSEDPALKKASPWMMTVSVLGGVILGGLVAGLKWGGVGGAIGAILGGILGWLAVAGLLKNTAEKTALGRVDPTLWRVWGTSVACTSIFYYLLEYAPYHFGMRLEVNHPLYALAAFGAGGLLCRLSWMLNGNGRAQGEFWRAQWMWVIVDLVVLGVVALIGLANFAAVDGKLSVDFFHIALTLSQGTLKALFIAGVIGMAAYGAWRFSQLGQNRAAKTDAAYWQNQWLAILGGVLLVGILPACVFYFGDSVFVIRPGFLLNLHTDYILEFRTFMKQMGFLSPYQIAGGISMIPIVALPLIMLMYAPDLQRAWKAVLSVALLPALVLLALALVQIRWLGISCALWCSGLVVAAAVTTLAGSAFRWRNGVRLPAGALVLFIVLVPFPVFSAYQWYATDFNKFSGPQELDLTQIVTRDVSQRIRTRLGSEQGVILSGPTTSTWMMYFGGFKSIGTLYWENVAGLEAAASMYSARPLWDDAWPLIQKNKVTHICIYSWDAFATEYARLGAGMRDPKDDVKMQNDQNAKLQESFVIKLISQRTRLPNWLRLIPYHMPEHPMLRYAFVLLFEVVPPQTDLEADLRHAQYAMDMGTPNGINIAAAELDAILKQHPDYLPALISNVLTFYSANRSDLMPGAMKAMMSHLDHANELALEDRVDLAIALLNGGQKDLAVQQAAACLAMAQEKDMRRLLTNHLQVVLQLAAELPPGQYPQKTFDLALSILPVNERSLVVAEEAAVASHTDTARSVALYHEALKLSPEFEQILSTLSQILSTSPDAAVRNGKEALDLANQAAKAAHLQTSNNLQLLACASAELGNWDDALFYANEALTLMQNTHSPDAALKANAIANWGEKIKLFTNHQPYHAP